MKLEIGFLAIMTFDLNYNMFKSTRKRQANRLTFEEELNKQLHHLKQQTPQKTPHLHKNKQIVTIIDEVVNELQTPVQSPPKKQGQKSRKHPNKEIQEIDSLQIDENSSISLNSRQDLREINHQEQNYAKIPQNHISNLVSHPEIINILIESFRHYSENESIQFYEFIKKLYLYYFQMELKQEEIFFLKNRLKTQLTTTDPQYLSLNALEIIAKRHGIKNYLQSAYIWMKIDQKTSQYEKKHKRHVQQLNQRQDILKQRQLKISINQEQYDRKIGLLLAKEKSINIKQKQLNLRQKELKKSIQQKMMKLYQVNLSQFSEKIKEAQKRLNNTEKNLKYKIEILQRRSQGLKMLINEKNYFKNKKITNENDAKIKLRRIQREMQELEKKHQCQIEIFEKQQKDLMKSISILEQKLSKSQRKCLKQKERIIQLQQQFTNVSENFEKIVQKCSDLEHRLQNIEQQPIKNQQIQIKLSKQKTSRSSKGKKRSKSSSEVTHLLPLYEIVLQCLNSNAQISHFQYQQLIQQVMKVTVKELPQIIGQLTASQGDQGAINKEPHYLVLNIARIVIKQFYFLNKKQQQAIISSNAKLKSPDIQQLLKYPYSEQTSSTILLLFLEIYDWDQLFSATFFVKTLQMVVEQMEGKSILKRNQLKNQQQALITSPQCIFFFINTFFPEIIARIEILQGNPQNYLKISISIVDLFLILIKEQEDVFAKLSQSNIQRIFIECLIVSIEGILNIYNQSVNRNKEKNTKITIFFNYIEQIEEFSEKMSIFMQRFYYKFNKTSKKFPQQKRLKGMINNLHQLNRSNGNRHSLILANMKSILDLFLNSQ